MNPRRWLSLGSVEDTDGDFAGVGRVIQGMPINGSQGSASHFPLARAQSLPAAAAAVPGVPLSTSSMTSIGEESGNKKLEEQPCRLRVTITKVKDLRKSGVGSGNDLNEFIFHLFVGQAEQTSKVLKYRPDEDGVSEVNVSFLFDVPGVEKSHLRVHAYRKQLWGTSKIGVCPAISIAGLFSCQQQQQPPPPPQQQQQQQPSSGSGCGGVGYGGTNERVARGSWIALQQKKGLREENVGMVYLDLLALRAPETVEQLSVLVGTWNVGNTPPPSDLSSWLPHFAVTEHAHHHHINLRESSNLVTGKAEAAAKAAGEIAGQATAAGGGGVGDEHLQEQGHPPVQKQREACQELQGEGGQRENLKGRASEERQRMRPHHIVAIGAQECDYEPPKPYRDTADHWVASLWDHLGRATYNLVKATSRGQMRLVVFVHHDYELAVRGVESITEATGAGNVMANKGAVVVSLKYWDTSLCFVNSHFAAHAGQCEARNEDYREVVQHARVGMVEMDILNQFQHLFWMGDLNYRLDLTETEKGKTVGGVSMSSKSMLPFPLSVRLIPPQGGCWRDGSGHRSSTGGANNVKNSERGLGGLNNSKTTSTDSSSSSGNNGTGNDNGSNNSSTNDDSSVGSGVNSINSFKRKESRKKKKPKEDLWKLVVEKIAERKFDELLTFDELRREQAMGRAFVGFQEGPIAFAPTFKVLRGKEEEYARSRAPAWCDRILRRSLPGREDDLVLQSHYSAPSITTSDHKPVGAIFSLAVYTLPVEQPAPFGNFLNGLDYLVHFKKLKASGLKKHDVIGLLPDPCVVFLGPNVAGSVRTKSKKSTLNPEWKEETETPVVVLRASSIERLEREYLYIQVMDTSSFGRSEETLGYGVLPLREAARAFELTRGKPPGVAVPFKIDLTRKGVVAGQLEGECRLTYERRCKYSRSCSARQLVIVGFRAGSRSFKENVSRLRDLFRRMLSQVTLLLRLRQLLGPAMETELASPVHCGRARGEAAVTPSPPTSELACFPSSPDPPRFFRLRTKIA